LKILFKKRSITMIQIITVALIACKVLEKTLKKD